MLAIVFLGLDKASGVSTRSVVHVCLQSVKGNFNSEFIAPQIFR
jgi:hypothetical protein